MDKQNVIESSVQAPSKSVTQNFVLRWAMSDSLLPVWWSRERDRYLREYWPSEDFIASTIYSITARNTQFTWELTGLDDDVKWAQDLLQSANFGQGWNSLIQQTSIDFLTQDNGAFWEIIRPAWIEVEGERFAGIKQYNEETDLPEWHIVKRGRLESISERDYKVFDSPLDLPIGIAHLDAGQVSRTGNVHIPYLYTDRYGKVHRMRPWQVVDFADLQSPIESMNGVGICALSRAFRTSHILQSVMIYKDEKIGGRYNRAVHITNADAALLQDQIMQTQQHANNLGALRYIQPVIASTFNPDATPAVATIDLASFPDGFDEDNTNSWAVAVLALAFGVDYGFLAPLPGKGLGTASQSETQARQAKGKSSAQFTSMITQALNFRGILPASVTFAFDDNDIDYEEAQEKMRKMRAETRKLMQENGEITPSISRQMAADAGDLSDVYLQMMGESDTTPVDTVEGEENVDAQETIEEAIDEQQELPTVSESETMAIETDNEENQTGGEKQIPIPETPSQEVSIALSEYAEEIEALVLQAYNGELEQPDFEVLLTQLVIGTLIALFAEEAGLNPEDITQDDLTPLENILVKNEEAISALADDIYNGRYNEEEGLGLLPLLGRLSLWVGSAAAASWLGVIANQGKRETKYRWEINPIKEHCESCVALDGQVHTAAEWYDFGVMPKSTDLLCFGLNCGCVLNEVSSDTPTQGNLSGIPLR